MSTITLLPVSRSCISTTRKRKRSSELRVSFSTQPHSIIYTYSQSDYDRSGLFPDTPSVPSKESFIFAVSINFVPAPLLTSSVVYPPKKKRMSNKPKLSIDTSNLHGPLYFTNMTTNHQKKEKAIADEHEEPVDSITKENTRRNSLPTIF